MFFDCLQIKWEYEFEGFELSNGRLYLPDFFLPRFHYPQGIYVEVKAMGGDCSKADELVLSGGGAILLAVGSPELRTYTLVCFNSKYLPGGSCSAEYRLFWHPSRWTDEIGGEDVEFAIRASRSKRFEGEQVGV